jgi:hypothetical protein
MATRIHPARKGILQNHKNKNKEKTIVIASANYVKDFIIAVTFSDGRIRLIDFLPLFHKYVKGVNLKYFQIEKFRKFILKNGTIYWGKNEDVIFTMDELYGDSNEKEEVLFII